MDVTKLIAANAKRLREGKKLTLDAAAAATGVSRSCLLYTSPSPRDA